MQRQMNRARGARVIRRSKGTEHCDYAVSRARIYRFMRAASVKTKDILDKDPVGPRLTWHRCQSMFNKWRLANAGYLQFKAGIDMVR